MKKRRIYLSLGLAVLLAAAFGISRLRAQESEELDPFKIGGPFLKVLFENNFVRVSQERMQPGESMRKHRHLHGVTVNLADYEMEQHMYPSGQIVHSSRHLGDVNWNDEMIHEAKNAGKTQQWVVRIELKY
jgi:hypothetical protein